MEWRSGGQEEGWRESEGRREGRVREKAREGGREVGREREREKAGWAKSVRERARARVGMHMAAYDPVLHACFGVQNSYRSSRDSYHTLPGTSFATKLMATALHNLFHDTNAPVLGMNVAQCSVTPLLVFPTLIP